MEFTKENFIALMEQLEKNEPGSLPQHFWNVCVLLQKHVPDSIDFVIEYFDSHYERGLGTDPNLN